MRVIVVHNRYRSAQPSGENRVVESDIAALEAEGVEVFPYIRDSDEIDGFTAIGKAGVAVRPLASPVDSIAFRRLLREVQPHIVHLHNPYPLISPWIVRTAKAMRVPVVQTVHNYRHVCANGLYFRDGHECTDCVGKSFPWPAIKHGCYRDSKLQSIPMATSLWVHRSTWLMVDRFLPVGEHVADHLRAFGIPDHKIIVRPNVVADPGEPKPLGHGALFVGRLSEEKGIRLLLDAWKLSGVGAAHTLTIAGDGELRPLVETAAASDPSVKYLGLVPSDQIGGLYEAAALVVVPSIWQETDGLAAVAAMAAGRAILATDTKAMRRHLGGDLDWLAHPSPDRFAPALGVLKDRSKLAKAGKQARRRFLSERNEQTAFTVRAYGGLIFLDAVDGDHPPLADRDWIRPRGFPSRHDVRATREPQPRDGLRLYAPQRPLAKLRYRSGSLPVLRWRLPACAAPPCDVDELIATLGIRADAVVAIRGSSPDRWIVGLETAGKLAVVVKCGPINDVGLQHEASMLAELRSADTSLRLPEVLYAGGLAGQFALATVAVPRRVGRVSLSQIAESATRLTNGDLGVPLVHGDLAQWNAIRTERNIWLLDWESSRRARVPLWDLADHLFKEGVLVGNYSPRQVANHLVAKGSVGWNHLLAVGEDPVAAPRHVLGYLNTRKPLGNSSRPFEHRLRSYLQ